MEKVVLEDALYLACRQIAEFTGSCPFDKYDYDMECDKRCESGIEFKCWKQYFIDLAKNS